MKIKTKKLFQAGYDVDSISDYVEGCLSRSFSSGQIEGAVEVARNNSRAIGVLVQILAEKGMLAAEQVPEICGQHEPQVEFVS